MAAVRCNLARALRFGKVGAFTLKTASLGVLVLLSLFLTRLVTDSETYNAQTTMSPTPFVGRIERPFFSSVEIENPKPRVLRSDNTAAADEDSAMTASSVKEALPVEATRERIRVESDVEVDAEAQRRRERDAEEEKAASLYVPPQGEVMKKRYPQCIIIGFAKCGTCALLSLLNSHPYIVSAGPEVHFFDSQENFQRGYDWYLDQMPPSYSNQITIEKTPAYVLTPKTLTELKARFPRTKVVAIMRDPVQRLLGQYVQLIRKQTDGAFSLTQFYRNKDTGVFDPTHFAVDGGVYHKHLRPWIESWPRNQILLLDGDVMIKNPLPTLQRMESYLGIPHLFKGSNFVLNHTKGFYCLRRFGEVKVRCLGDTKGAEHPRLPEEEEKMLREFYRPHNCRLLRLTGEEFSWGAGEGGGACLNVS